jgi:hypothetical protein
MLSSDSAERRQEKKSPNPGLLPTGLKAPTDEAMLGTVNFSKERTAPAKTILQTKAKDIKLTLNRSGVYAQFRW